MTELTEAEMRFAVMLAKGDQSQSECYRQCFPKTLTWTADSVKVAASRLANRANVALTVQELRQGAAEQAKDAFAEHTAMLRRVYETGMERDENGKPIGLGAAGKAAENLGKAQGIYETRIRDVTAENVQHAEQLVRELLDHDDPEERKIGMRRAEQWGMMDLIPGTKAAADVDVPEGATVQ